MFPEDRVAIERLAGERGNEALAFQRRDGDVADLLGILRAGEIDAGRDDVDEVARAACGAAPAAAIPFGQWAISGVLMPPSWTQCLYSRNGVFDTFAQPRP